METNALVGRQLMLISLTDTIVSLLVAAWIRPRRSQLNKSVKDAMVISTKRYITSKTCTKKMQEDHKSSKTPSTRSIGSLYKKRAGEIPTEASMPEDEDAGRHGCRAFVTQRKHLTPQCTLGRADGHNSRRLNKSWWLFVIIVR